MTCEERQLQILLSQSDELSAEDQLDLEKHLDQCPLCHTFSAELGEITAAEEVLSPQRKVSEWSLVRIRRRATAHHRSTSFYQTWRPALLYGAAAIFLLLFTLRFTASQRVSPGQTRVSQEIPSWDDNWDVVMSDLTEQLTMLSANHDMNNAKIDHREESLDDIARDILELEEWNI